MPDSKNTTIASRITAFFDRKAETPTPPPPDNILAFTPPDIAVPELDECLLQCGACGSMVYIITQAYNVKCAEPTCHNLIIDLSTVSPEL